jgi:simple sugar transport system permease protein
MLAGGLMNLVMGYLTLTRRANQLASGLALMFFGFGLSALIGRPFVGAKINGLPRIALPGISNLPVLYASLFRFDLLIYLAIPAAVLVWWLLFRTRWGLGLRAVGESADIAFASGRNPRRIRYQALFAGGLLAGLGAAHLSIAYAMNWTEYMTAGRGFIAVALVIFSKWHPLRAIGGALLFSGAVAFQLLLQSSVSDLTVPVEHHPVCRDHPGAGPVGRHSSSLGPGELGAGLPGKRIEKESEARE